MQEVLTHWKKTVNPEYLGSYALEPGKDLIATINFARVEQVVGNSGKKEDKLVIHFMEADIKPMICNRTNAKTITKIHRTPYLEQWSGKAIQLYSSRISAFGEEVDALRVRDFIPQVVQYDPTEAIQTLHRCTTLAELKKAFTSLPKEAQGHQAVVSTKDQLKEVLK